MSIKINQLVLTQKFNPLVKRQRTKNLFVYNKPGTTNAEKYCYDFSQGTDGWINTEIYPWQWSGVAKPDTTDILSWTPSKTFGPQTVKTKTIQTLLYYFRFHHYQET